jgi:hypothetical protein
LLPAGKVSPPGAPDERKGDFFQDQTAPEFNGQEAAQGIMLGDGTRRLYPSAHMATANPLFLGELPLEEPRASRGLQWQKEAPPEPTKDAMWKHMGLFNPDGPDRFSTSSKAGPSEAPHRASTGFAATQRQMSPRELLQQRDAQLMHRNREMESIGVTSYFNNDLAPFHCEGVRRTEYSRQTETEGVMLGDTDTWAPSAEKVGVATHLRSPWAIDGYNTGVEAPETFVGPAPGISSAQTGQKKSKRRCIARWLGAKFTI